MSAASQPTVAIIGAGPGGLASALLLAKSGVKVTVFERSKEVGGRNKVFERDGFKFDLGPTFFHYPEVIEDIFASGEPDSPPFRFLTRPLNGVPIAEQFASTLELP